MGPRIIARWQVSIGVSNYWGHLSAYHITQDGDLNRVATLDWEPRMSDLVTR